LAGAIFLALAMAANFTALFLVAGEGLWLAYLALARTQGWPGGRLRVAAPAWSLIGGVTLLLPFARSAVAVSDSALAHGALDWIRYQPPLGWTYHLLRDDAGDKWLFRLLLALAAFGFWRYEGKARMAPLFMATVAASPFVVVAMLSLWGRPMMVDRYVLLGEVAFLGLAAVGVSALESVVARALVLLLIVWLSARALRHSSFFWVDWRGAAVIANTDSRGDREIGVVPGYAVNVVRYSLPPARRGLAVAIDSNCGNSEILIVSPGRPIAPARLTELRTCYPRLLGTATRVEVRGR
jgi:hypothetical protein